MSRQKPDEQLTTEDLPADPILLGVLTVEAARAVLAEHQVDVDWYRRRDGYAWSCSCLTDGEDTHRTAAEAWQSAAGHQAEQLVAALGNSRSTSRSATR